MTTRKDVVFATVIGLDIVLISIMLIIDIDRVTILCNLYLIFTLTILLILKNYTKLGAWLETPLKNKDGR